MSRRWPWRSKPSAAEAAILADVDAGTIRCFMLAELGATSFVVKERHQSNPDDPAPDQHPQHQPKYKVRIGDEQTCDCGVAKAGVTLCSHIFFVMKRVLRVTDQSCLAFQLSLTENEVDDILNKREQQRIQQTQSDSQSNNQSKNNNSSKDKTVKIREIAEDDVCVVCQEVLIESTSSQSRPSSSNQSSEQPEQPAEVKALTCCSRGCGGSLHASCMRVWAEHQQQTGAQSITCPMCRSAWNADQSDTQLIDQLKYDEEHPVQSVQSDSQSSSESKRARQSKSKPSSQLNLPSRVRRRCKECRSVVSASDPLVRCVTCSDYNACRNCVRKAMKPIQINSGPDEPIKLHSHILVQRQGARWGVPIVKANRSHASLVSELQQRELTAADYETLLALDAGNAPLHTYVAAAFETWKTDHQTANQPDARLLPPCVWCLSVNSHRLCALSCGCAAHEHCINSACMFEVDKLNCPGCHAAVFPGLVEWNAQAERANKAPKVKAVTERSNESRSEKADLLLEKRPFNETLAGSTILNSVPLRQVGTKQQLAKGRRSKLLALTESTSMLSLSQSFDQPLVVSNAILPSINSRASFEERKEQFEPSRFNQSIPLAHRPRVHSMIDRSTRAAFGKSIPNAAPMMRARSTEQQPDTQTSLQLPSLFGLAANAHPRSAPSGESRRPGVLRRLGALHMKANPADQRQLEPRLH